MPSKIRKRGNGTYEIAAYAGYDAHGRQIVKRKTIKAKTDREAKKMQASFEASLQHGNITLTGKLKVSEFAHQWFHDHCEKKLAPKTQRSYLNHLNTRILPALGHIDINKLCPQHIIKFLNDLQESPSRFDGRDGNVSSESFCYSFRVLSSMLQDAVHWQIIPSNPCKRVEPPKAARKKIKVMNETDVSQMLAALQEEPLKYRTIVMLALDSGLRLGELMGLKWQDIDLEHSLVSVNKANQALVGKGIFTKCPKNESSVRSVVISNSTTILLRTYRCEQLKTQMLLGEKWIDEGWLFTQWNGKAMYPDTPSHWFRDFLAKHSLPHMRFHALRHLSATVLISQGVPLKNVSSRLGHADIRTTANIYSEALQSVDRQAASKMDEFLQRTGVS